MTFDEFKREWDIAINEWIDIQKKYLINNDGYIDWFYTKCNIRILLQNTYHHC